MQTQVVIITLRTEIPPKDLVTVIQQALRDQHIIPSTIEVR